MSAEIKVPSENGSSNSSNPSPQPHQNGQDAQKIQRRVPDMQLGKCHWVVLLNNIAYITSGIVLREHEGRLQVLLIQEAKKSCRGKWYFPAGHVEPGETIEEATKRELKEETGFDVNVDCLISVEINGSGWYRFCYACTIIGGTIKTEPDKESLCADWYDIESVKKREITIRCNDFLKLLDEAVKYRNWRNSIAPSISEYPQVLNIDENQPGLFVEFVIVKRSSDQAKVEVLTHQSVKHEEEIMTSNDGFPTVEFGFEYSFPMVLSKCYRHMFETPADIDIPSGVIGVSCLPKPLESLQHGIRLRILCYHKKSTMKAQLHDTKRYHWLNVQNPKVLSHLCLLPNQFQPALFML